MNKFAVGFFACVLLVTFIATARVMNNNMQEGVKDIVKYNLFGQVVK
jgi:hypothetical protein